jgi:hypothetical protein
MLVMLGSAVMYLIVAKMQTGYVLFPFVSA